MSSSEIQLTFYEKRVLFFRKLKNKLLYLHKLGQTKIGFLFIPHNPEKIAKFEMTVYLILFILSMSSLLFVLSIGYAVSFFTSKDQDYIFEKGRQQRAVFLHHYMLAEQLKSSLTELNLQVEDLSKATWGKYTKENLELETQGLVEPEVAAFFSQHDEMQSNMKVFQETVDRFREIHRSLGSLYPVFLNTTEYLETREAVVQAIPRGRPLGPGVGFISSVYGRREDPVKGGGEFHNGVDFAAPNGTPIYASAPGVVAEAGYSENSFGNYVRLNHENGFSTFYAHCSALKVKKGDKVKRGDLIGFVGSTGKSTGYHLHYEVHIGLDPPYNPQEFINLK